MEAPEQDLEDRSALWDVMQMVWMDTDVNMHLEEMARTCACSKYSLEELEQIFWNEIRPAVRSNLSILAGPAPQWSGFTLEELQRRVLAKHRHGRPIRFRWLDPYSRSWWRNLEAAILALRNPTSAGASAARPDA